MSSFMLSCGGTGGHLSPGIAIAEGLVERGHSVTLLISNKAVDGRLSSKYPHLRFERIEGTRFGLSPAVFLRCLISQTKGFLRCRALLRQQKASCVMGFGGFTSAPLAVAARLQGLPVVIHEANRVPGLAVRLVGRFASRVYLPEGVALPSSRPGILRPAGLPVRSEIRKVPAELARAALGLHVHGKVLVVLGGSQGASALNAWLQAELPALMAEGIQVCCVTGMGKFEARTIDGISRKGLPVRSLFIPFSDKMGELLSAADLVVSRAGAGTIAELVRCQIPSLLIPYPHAADDHQRANALHFEKQGCCMVVAQDALSTLRTEVTDLLFNDWLLHRMRGNLQRLEHSSGPTALLDDLEQLAAKAALREGGTP